MTTHMDQGCFSLTAVRRAWAAKLGSGVRHSAQRAACRTTGITAPYSTPLSLKQHCVLLQRCVYIFKGNKMEGKTQNSKLFFMLYLFALGGVTHKQDKPSLPLSFLPHLGQPHHATDGSWTDTAGHAPVFTVKQWKSAPALTEHKRLPPAPATWPAPTLEHFCRDKNWIAKAAGRRQEQQEGCQQIARSVVEQPPLAPRPA